MFETSNRTVQREELAHVGGTNTGWLTFRYHDAAEKTCLSVRASVQN